MVNPQPETPRQAVHRVAAALTAAGCPDADYDAETLVSFVLGRDSRLAEGPLTQSQALRLESLVQRRCAREPLQYLIGQWGFLRFTLAVGPGVLCPRPDTETVAEAAADALLTDRTCPAPRVLDLCAGSGALGLGVKSLCPAAKVTCLEKSPEAFFYLEQNLAALEPLGIPAPAVKAVQGDLFTYYRTLPEASFDAIVSNPPYLTEPEMAALQPETAQEPAMALAGGADGLVFYRAIAEHYQKALRPGGLLCLEIGWQQGAAVAEILRGAGFQQCEVRRDFGGNDRCVLARRKA